MSDIKFWLWSCSCCGGEMTKHEGRTYEEGDLCLRCYTEQMYDAHLHELDSFALVEDALTGINKVKFKYAEIWMKRYWVDEMRKKGFLKYSIK